MTKKKTEVVGWHEVSIKTTNKDADCGFDVVTPHAGRLLLYLADSDVVALSWKSGSQEFLLRTDQIVRVIVEELEPAQLDDEDREDLLKMAVPLTASIHARMRVRLPDESKDSFIWTQLFRPSEGES